MPLQASVTMMEVKLSGVVCHILMRLSKFRKVLLQPLVRKIMKTRVSSMSSFRPLCEYWEMGHSAKLISWKRYTIKMETNTRKGLLPI